MRGACNPSAECWPVVRLVVMIGARARHAHAPGRRGWSAGNPVALRSANRVTALCRHAGPRDQMWTASRISRNALPCSSSRAKAHRFTLMTTPPTPSRRRRSLNATVGRGIRILAAASRFSFAPGSALVGHCHDYSVGVGGRRRGRLRRHAAITSLRLRIARARSGHRKRAEGAIPPNLRARGIAIDRVRDNRAARARRSTSTVLLMNPEMLNLSPRSKPSPILHPPRPLEGRSHEAS